VADYQPVHKGDLLFQIEDTDYRARVDRAAAELTQAQAAVRAAEAQVAQAQAQIGVAVAEIHSADAGLQQARLEKLRQAELLHTESYLQRDWQNANASERSQQAAKDGRVKDLAAAEAQVDVLRAQADQARAQVTARQAALDFARIELGYTKISAPVDGIVTARLLRQGAYAAAGSTLITVVPAEPVWVVANYREVALTRMLPGQPVDVHVDALPNVRLHGHVDSLEPLSQAELSALPPDRAAGNFTKVTQRVPLKIDLDPRPELEGALRLGLSAETWVETAR
jgi:membrane fusion protein (multidrug efflux system)